MSLGQRIRAARLGYHWTGTCFMRISDHHDPECWRDAKWFVENFAAARIKPKRAFTIYVNDLGEVI